MLALFFSTFGALFSVVNPVGAVPVFLALTSDQTQPERAKLARITSLWFVLILLAFFMAGTLILDFFGLSLNALRIAGGLIIVHSGYGLLNGTATERRVSPEAEAEAQERQDIAFTPLAMPLLSGPGSISLLIGLYASNPEFIARWVVAGAVLLMGVVVFLILRSAPFLNRLLGVAGLQALSRIMGFLVMSIGIQYIITGLVSLVRDLI